MLITSDKIKSLNPCNDRWENFNANYPNFKGNLEEFLNLDLITYNDKIWIGLRLMNKQQNIKFSLRCAESILHIYENEYPNDKRLKKLLNFLKSIQDFENMTEVQKVKLLRLKKSADNAYHDIYKGAIIYHAAGIRVDDAVSALHIAQVVFHISDAAYYCFAITGITIYLNSANDAAYAAAYYAKENQQELNLLFMKQALETN